MKVDFGTQFEMPRDWDLEKARRTLQELEGLGFLRISHGDTPSVLPECYVVLTLMALNTQRVQIGPLVTNPLLREPSVIAAALATVDGISNGRAVLAVSTGDSALFGIGLRPASLEQLKEYVLAVRGLLRKGEARYQGRQHHIFWSSLFRRRDIPIYIVAEGPKTLRLAGQIADGVVIGSGLLTEVVADAKEAIHQGAREAGRDPESLDLWWHARGNIERDRRKAVEALMSQLASIANHATRFTLEGKRVPNELHGAFKELHRRYEYSQHTAMTARNPNAALLEEMGLSDYVAERWGLVGTADDIIERVNRLATYGVKKLWLGGLMRRPETSTMFGQQVLPHFRV
ncbi:MAG: LLM class flavin-dependent oxidoreductase [Chloroflexi bacterium]|nr:LLM class flavin-dependent oxidoreductase [Chloroflexota bacterium]